MQLKFYDYLYPVLKAHESGAILQVKELYNVVAAMVELTEEQMRKPMGVNGKQLIYRNRISWAKTYISRAGLIENRGKGLWQITEKGKNWLVNQPTLTLLDLKEIGGEAYKKFTEVPLDKGASQCENIKAVNEQTTPDEQMNDAWKKLNEKVSEQLYDLIMSNDFYFFEQLIIDLMEAMGYGVRFDNGKAMQRTNDEGIDGIINQDKLGLEQIYLQAKRYCRGNKVGGPEIHAFVGALSVKGATKGVFVTTSKFTAAAWEIANNIKEKKIVLVDRDKLLNLMMDHNLGVRKERMYEIKAIDLDYFEVSD
ncbi:MAG: restriction endonuclease [Culicoidibacterales bacterium]